jgi:ASC-1-like (ASCH) protein
MRLVFREVDRARFDEVQSGQKTIETRAATEKYKAIKVGDEITFACGSDTFTKKVAKIYHWPSIEAMLAEVPLSRVMPDLQTIEQVQERYASYPGYEEKIKDLGILGLLLSEF